MPLTTGYVLLAGGGGSGSGITATGAVVNTDESTASSTFVDLTTPGPAVTFTVPASGNVTVFVSAQQHGGDGDMGFALTGANTVAATAVQAAQQVYNSNGTVTGVFFLTGLTAGSTTFTCKYLATNASTCSFLRRNIVVMG